MQRVNDIRFADLLDRAIEIAMEYEDYECIPLMQLDGTRLDDMWRTAYPNQVRMYREHVDRAWRQHVRKLQAA